MASGVLPPSLRSTTSSSRTIPWLANQRSLHPVDILEAKIRSRIRRGQSSPTSMRGDATASLGDLARPEDGPQPALRGRGILDESQLCGDVDSRAGRRRSRTSRERAARSCSNIPAVPAQPFRRSSTTRPMRATFPGERDPVNDSLAARQLYARHLYVLTMALADTNALLTDLQKTNPSCHVRRRGAVDCPVGRERGCLSRPQQHHDSLPLRPEPVHGGNRLEPPDNTPQHTVWGCKRPELLITETLAFHDRRTQDLNDEVVDKSKPGRITTNPERALTAGSRPIRERRRTRASIRGYRPQGSLFVELYNPWTILEPRTTIDLGPSPPTGPNWPNGGVQLDEDDARGRRQDRRPSGG